MRITSRQVRWLLILTIAALSLLHIVFVLQDINNQGLRPRGLVWLFDFDAEYNLPSSYNGFLLAASGAISWLLAWRNKLHIQAYWWLALGAAFFYLSFDEILLIHEQVAMPIRNALALDNSNPFFHAWVIPAFIMITVVGCYLLYAFTRRGGFGFAPNKIILLLFLMATGVVVIEIVGTRTFLDTTFYRLVTVPVEEIYEIGMSSAILYNLLKIVHPQLAQTQKKRP